MYQHRLPKHYIFFSEIRFHDLSVQEIPKKYSKKSRVVGKKSYPTGTGITSCSLFVDSVSNTPSKGSLGPCCRSCLSSGLLIAVKSSLNSLLLLKAFKRQVMTVTLCLLYHRMWYYTRIFDVHWNSTLNQSVPNYEDFVARHIQYQVNTHEMQNFVINKFVKLTSRG